MQYLVVKRCGLVVLMHRIDRCDKNGRFGESLSLCDQIIGELEVEITFNELQSSRQYPAGLALRFARVKRYREDKSAAEADTLQTVQAISAARSVGQAP